MYQTKRSSVSRDSLHNQRKKLRIETFHTKNIKFTCIECLSNELFYEIFEYLDGNDIYRAFFNLNSRFQHLITYSSFPLRIKVHSEIHLELTDSYKNLIILNRHHIVSLDWEKQSFITDFFTYYTFDSSFVCLQSLVFRKVSLGKAMLLLFYMKTLPRLTSLTIDINEEYSDHADIYRLIFSLPFLKYMKLSLYENIDNDIMSVSVPLAANEPLSPIEHLVIDHRCTDNELFSILQHTPQLRHLIIDNSFEFDNLDQIEHSVVLPSMTYIRFDYFFGDFHDLKICMAKISASLEVLIINTVFGTSYVDAGQWEQFIIRYMPRLRRLELTYDNYCALDYEGTSYAEIINQFASPFWFERQCLFEVKITKYYVSYSIRPYKNIWFDIYKHAEIVTFCNGNISNGSNQPLQLTIEKQSFGEPFQSFLDKFKLKFTGVQFTRLNINCEHIPIGIFIQIIDLLPNLDSLKVSSLPVIQPGWLFDDDEQIRYLTAINNKITKVNFENLIDIEQVHFILYICLRMEYFQMDVPQDIDLQVLLRYILGNSSTYSCHLKAICLSFPSTNEELVDKLCTLIESEKLLINYMIKRIGNHIILKWN